MPLNLKRFNDNITTTTIAERLGDSWHLEPFNTKTKTVRNGGKSKPAS
jgi:hypothetical protein